MPNLVRVKGNGGVDLLEFVTFLISSFTLSGSITHKYHRINFYTEICESFWFKVFLKRGLYSLTSSQVKCNIKVRGTNRTEIDSETELEEVKIRVSFQCVVIMTEMNMKD